MGLTRTRNPLVLTMGDPDGIAPEITVKAWQALRGDTDMCFAVIGSPQTYAGCDSTHQIETLSEAADVFATHLPILPINQDTQAQAIINSIAKAVDLTLLGHADGIITNPISKDRLYKAGFKHAGHTEYLGHLTQDHPLKDQTLPRGPVMMLAGGGLRVALATIHMPLAHAAKILDKDTIVRTLKVMHQALIQDFGIPTPRIAMTGLNPHAGENGALGQEEIDIINPAAQVLRDLGITVTDAQPADTLFHAEARKGYDAVLAMYHDQGLIPVKTLDFHGGVNITLGLPIVRTSPDHGTAFDIAGQNIARPDSLIAAIGQAREIADNRARAHG